MTQNDHLSRKSDLPFGSTDCAQPMLWALERKLDFDTFVIYTDSETWCGKVHPTQALRDYRRKRVAAAKLAVIMNLFTTAFNYAAEPFFFKNADIILCFFFQFITQ